MILEIVIAVATLLVALNGLLYQPKKDPDRRVSWNNLNLYGKILIGLLISLLIFGLLKTVVTEKQTREKVQQQTDQIARRDKEIQRLLASQDELKRTNQHLIKVMSVADGYNASIRGVVSFNRSMSESQIRSALENLFLKFSEIQIKAENLLGRYEGKVDYATHPEVRRFRNLAETRLRNASR